MSIKWILLAVFLLVTVAYCQDDNYSYDTPDNEDSYDEESYDDGYSYDEESNDEESVESDDAESNDESNDEESVESEESEESVESDDQESDNEDSDEQSDESEESDDEDSDNESDDEDSNDESDDEDPNGSEEVIITGNISNNKMTFQILDLASDIRSDIAFVLNIPISSVRILSLDDNGSTYTALVELLDSASLSAEEAANELRKLEATNDPILQNTTLENADVEIVIDYSSDSNSFQTFSASSFTSHQRSHSSSSASILSATFLVFVATLFML
mmetsp:Transcript_35217/g.76388  ORF Transcript_35217/g.76388 Transcript_35217/m.76388 type:complete len:275 (+) Transcript_35217:83-907(+)